MDTKPIFTAIALVLALGQGSSSAHAQNEAPLALALDRTESIRQVRDLQNRLAQYIETGDWDGAIGLFSAQATVELGMQTAAGHKAIRTALVGHFGAGSAERKGLRASLLMAPVLTLSPDGMNAQGRWHEVGMFGGSSVSDNWTGGIYENTYIRENGTWRIAHLGYHAQFAGDYANGWKNLVPDLPVIPYHYQAETVGTPAYASAAPGAPVPPISAPMIAARAQRLDDEEQVRNLQYIYGYYRDRRMWPDVTDLFAPDSSFSSAEIGTYRGAEGI
ncbi:MAG TPA: nuclear transport factor 2 family protein, partial [Sphingomonadaceae bacterium]|nr:nuclear transport factor 2 family protein [Sphingomonadaceae bacterium]